MIISNAIFCDLKTSVCFPAVFAHKTARNCIIVFANTHYTQHN